MEKRSKYYLDSRRLVSDKVKFRLISEKGFQLKLEEELIGYKCYDRSLPFKMECTKNEENHHFSFLESNCISI